MSDTVEIPVPDFGGDGAVAKKSKRQPKAAVVEAKAASAPAVLEGLSLNSALAEIESARVTRLTPRKPMDKSKRPPPNTCVSAHDSPSEVIRPEFIADNPELPPRIERAFLWRAPREPVPENDLGIDLPIFPAHFEGPSRDLS